MILGTTSGVRTPRPLMTFLQLRNRQMIQIHGVSDLFLPDSGKPASAVGHLRLEINQPKYPVLCLVWSRLDSSFRELPGLFEFVPLSASA